MAMSDPIADMLTRIRNAQLAEKASVSMPSSKLKVAIAAVLKDEGYRRFCRSSERRQGNPGNRAQLLRRPSGHRAYRARFKPGLRIYKGCDDIPRVMNGLGVAIVSTLPGCDDRPQGRANKVGGEVLCIVA